MGRSVKSQLSLTAFAASTAAAFAASTAAAFAASIGGCQFHQAGNSVQTGTAGTGGTAVVDAGSPGTGGATGLGGQGGIPTFDFDASAKPDATGMSNPDSNCAAVNQGAAPLPPDILILLDRSGSMEWNADASCMRNCGAESRWRQVTDALNQVIPMTDTSVNWGLKFFGSGNNCAVTADPEVPIAAANGQMITTRIAMTTPGTPTPTRLGVNAGAAYMATLTSTNPKYLLLATDGEPTCNPDTPMMMNASDAAGAQQAVTDAFNMGFKTFVVGVGDTMGAATLDQMAINGGMPQTGAATSFYQVTDTASLVAALQTILGRVGSCQFEIGMAPNSMTTNDLIDVFGDGMPISRDPTHTDGWDYSNAAKTAIEVFGPRCDAIKAGTTVNVTVTFRCIIG
jgi:hypothetical protein